MQLRLRPARALPEWDEDDALFPYVLGLFAFGLEECNLYPQAEEAGRRATAGAARVPWAVHAVAHAMEMQGRFEDGAAWLRQQQPQWASDDNGFAGHLWWHLGLFRIEGLDAPACCGCSMRTCRALRCRSRCSGSTRRRCCGACSCSGRM